MLPEWGWFRNARLEDVARLWLCFCRPGHPCFTNTFQTDLDCQSWICPLNLADINKVEWGPWVLCSSQVSMKSVKKFPRSSWTCDVKHPLGHVSQRFSALIPLFCLLWDKWDYDSYRISNYWTNVTRLRSNPRGSARNEHTWEEMSTCFLWSFFCNKWCSFQEAGYVVFNTPFIFCSL